MMTSRRRAFVVAIIGGAIGVGMAIDPWTLIVRNSIRAGSTGVTAPRGPLHTLPPAKLPTRVSVGRGPLG